MKKINFIERLIIENRIKIVEPSLEICNSYREKSKNSLKASKLLLKENLLEDSTSRAYYSMFHEATALLFLIGLKCENHDATIILLKELVKLDNSLIASAKKNRIDKEYYMDFNITKKEVNEMIKNSETFIEMIEKYIDKINISEKNELLEDFKITYLK